MSKIAALLAVLMFALAATASAGPGPDLRSPDARPAVAPAQDYRSADARPIVSRSVAAVQDLRAPDARLSGRFVSGPVSHPASTSTNSFDWGYLALAVGMALSCLAVVLITARRRRHGLAIGG